jgi:hypothetical protein
MATERSDTGTDPQALADHEAVLRHACYGEPLDPEVARRVHERAAKITEEIYRTHGLIDDETFQKLLSDDDDEEV